MLTPNTRLANGRYIIQRQLGAGNMAEVYLAKDTGKNIDVALKVLRPSRAADPQYAEYFQNEIAVLQKLQHPNIVRYYDWKQENQLLFLALEYIAGPTLQEYLSAKKLLPMPDAFYIAASLAIALDYAHANGVIHRDIKPSNVMLAHSGMVLLNDFGVARNANRGPSAAGPIGTIAYMAPEQITGSNVAAAADQYSLGILLWELLTGSRPFNGESAGLQSATPDARLIEEHQKYPPPSGVLPAELAAPLMRALAKPPEQRFPTCSAMVQAMMPPNGIQATTQQKWMQAVRTYNPQPRTNPSRTPAPPQRPPQRPPPAALLPRLIPKASIPRLVIGASIIVSLVLLLVLSSISPGPARPVATATPTTASTP